MARNTVKTEISVEDLASKEVKEITDTLIRETERIKGADKGAAKSAAEVAKERAKQLTLNQRYSFQLQKIQAGQDKVKLSLIGHKEALEKAKRELRLLVKTGDEVPTQIKEEIRKRQGLITKLEGEIKARGNVSTSIDRVAPKMRLLNKQIGTLTLKHLLAAKALRMLGGQLKRVVVDTAKSHDDYRKTSERLGITVEQFQRLDYAMQISGTSMENNRQAFAKLNKITRDAALGMGEASTKMERLGVKTTNADGSLKSTNEVLLDVADRFKNMGTGAEKTAASLDLFEESGYKMIQFLSLGREGIEELSAEADSLGVVIGEGPARRAEEFNDSLLQLSKTYQGQKNIISSVLTPQMTVMVDKFRDMFSATGQTGEQMNVFFAVVIASLLDVAGIFSKVGQFLWFTFRSIMTGITGVIATITKGLGGALTWIGEKLGKDMSGLEKFGEAADKAAKAQAAGLADIIKDGDKFREGLDEMKEGVLSVAAEYKTELEPAAKETNKTSEKLKTLIAEANEETKKHTGSIKLQKLATDGMNQKMKDDIDEIREKRIAAAAEQYDQITGLINPALRALTSEAENFAEASKNALKAFVGVLGTMAEEAIKKYALSAAAGAASSQSAIPIIGPAMAAAAMSATLAMVMGLLTRMNKGGIVPGVGSVDKIPALLTPGELVLPKDLSAELLALVGRRPAGGAMAAGGLVTAGAGAGIVVNINEQVMTPRTPGELDRFVKDQLIPSLSRLRRRGF